MIAHIRSSRVNTTRFYMLVLFQLVHDALIPRILSSCCHWGKEGMWRTLCLCIIWVSVRSCSKFSNASPGSLPASWRRGNSLLLFCCGQPTQQLNNRYFRPFVKFNPLTNTANMLSACLEAFFSHQSPLSALGWRICIFIFVTVWACVVRPKYSLTAKCLLCLIHSTVYLQRNLSL